MQESAGDLVGEEWGDDRLLLSIKDGVHPNPGAESCIHAVLSSWAIVSNADGCQAIRRRFGDGVSVGQGLVDACRGPRRVEVRGLCMTVRGRTTVLNLST